MAERVLVTGATGFVGGHLVSLLLDEQPAAEVVGWLRPDPTSGNRHRRSAHLGRGRTTLQQVDVLERDAVDRAVAELQPQQIYHCAGVAAVAGSWNDRLSTLRTNVLGTEHLLAAVERHAPVARVLVPGSALVYRPHDGPLDERGRLGPIQPLRSEQAGRRKCSRRATPPRAWGFC